MASGLRRWFLRDFLRRKHAVPDTVELLVLRNTEIDSQLENNPETTLGTIQGRSKHIRFAIHKLKQHGFHEVVIATDHGFFLNAHAEAGDVCVKPRGTGSMCTSAASWAMAWPIATVL